MRGEIAFTASLNYDVIFIIRITFLEGFQSIFTLYFKGLPKLIPKSGIECI